MNKIYYIQLWKKRLRITNPKTKEIFDEDAVVAMKKDLKGKLLVAGVGRDAENHRSNDCLIVNPFNHCRSLVSDFYIAEKFISEAIRSLEKRRFFSLAPKIIMHPMEGLEGGITPIEEKVLVELGISVGARECLVYVGPELNVEIINFQNLKADLAAVATSSAIY